MKQLVCWFRGHEESADMLPEEPFGLYAYSRLWCRRCGVVLVERPIEEQIEVLMGYVTLWNDVRPIVEAAGWVAASCDGREEPIAELIASLERYEALYPEHRIRVSA